MPLSFPDHLTQSPSGGLVSVISIFFNPETFVRETIECHRANLFKLGAAVSRRRIDG